MNTFKNLTGDSKEVLKTLLPASVSLIITSPPYADARKNTYGGTPPDDYVSWFLPISEQLKRVLAPTGTFILNIKEKVVNTERHTYVLELILALRKQGWLWTEEWIWYKKNSTPGHWSNRFRDAFERCLQFNLQKKFKMNQKAVMTPIGDWAKKRNKNLTEKDKTRESSSSGSSFGKVRSNWLGKELVYPSNVLCLPTECGNKKHSAVFPKALPSFFIKLFSDPDDIVLDPFEGSGTSGVAAIELNRNYIGIDMDSNNTIIAHDRIKNVQPFTSTFEQEQK